MRPAGALLGLLLLSGCATWSYERVQLGQPKAEYEKLLPSDYTRSTDAGLCYFRRRALGRYEIMLIVLTPDRRVAGKFLAHWRARRDVLREQRSFDLRGELSPGLAGLGDASPSDCVRALLIELETRPDQRKSLEGQRWVAAGLVRILQRWPEGPVTVPEPGGLEDLLDQVPADGAAQVRVNADGSYHLEYGSSG